MLVDDVIARLKEAVPALQTRVNGAASLVQLIAQNQLGQHSPAAHVIGLGIRGGAPDVVTGLFRQPVVEQIGVILTFRNATGAGAGALDRVEAVRTSVIEALCGWEPEGAFGPFQLQEGRVTSMQAGTLVYELSFAIPDQLRIST